jgi:hypothetical protein
MVGGGGCEVKGQSLEVEVYCTSLTIWREGCFDKHGRRIKSISFMYKFKETERGWGGDGRRTFLGVKLITGCVI